MSPLADINISLEDWGRGVFFGGGGGAKYFNFMVYWYFDLWSIRSEIRLGLCFSQHSPT